MQEQFRHPATPLLRALTAFYRAQPNAVEIVKAYNNLLDAQEALAAILRADFRARLGQAASAKPTITQ